MPRSLPLPLPPLPALLALLALVLLAAAPAARAALRCASVSSATPACTLAANFTALPTDTVLNATLAPGAAACYRLNSTDATRGVQLWISGAGVRMYVRSAGDPFIVQCSWTSLRCAPTAGLNIGFFCDSAAPCTFQFAGLLRLIQTNAEKASQQHAHYTQDISGTTLLLAVRFNATAFPSGNVRTFDGTPPVLRTEQIGMALSTTTNYLALGVPYWVDDFPTAWPRLLAQQVTPLFGQLDGSLVDSTLTESTYFCTRCCQDYACGELVNYRWPNVRLLEAPSLTSSSNYLSCSADAGSIVDASDPYAGFTGIRVATLGGPRSIIMLEMFNTSATNDLFAASRTLTFERAVIELNASDSHAAILSFEFINQTGVALLCSVGSRESTLTAWVWRSINQSSYTAASVFYSNTSSLIDCTLERQISLNEEGFATFGVPEFKAVRLYHTGVQPPKLLVEVLAADEELAFDTHYGRRSVVFNDTQPQLVVGGSDTPYHYDLTLSTAAGVSNYVGLSPSALQLGSRRSSWPTFPALFAFSEYADSMYLAFDTNAAVGSASQFVALGRTAPGTMWTLDGTTVLCPVGMNKSSTGFQSCEMCPAYTYASSVGSATCSQCPATGVCPLGSVSPLKSSALSVALTQAAPFGIPVQFEGVQDVVASSLFVRMNFPYLPTGIAVTLLLLTMSLICLAPPCERGRGMLRRVDMNKEPTFNQASLQLQHKGSMVGGCLSLWLYFILIIGFVFLIVYALSYSQCPVPSPPPFDQVVGAPFNASFTEYSAPAICDSNALIGVNVLRTSSLNPLSGVSSTLLNELNVLASSVNLTLHVELVGFISEVSCSALCSGSHPATIFSSGCFDANNAACSTTMTPVCTTLAHSCRVSATIPTPHEFAASTILSVQFPVNVYANALTMVLEAPKETVTRNGLSVSSAGGFLRITRSAGVNDVIRGTVNFRGSLLISIRDAQVEQSTAQNQTAVMQFSALKFGGTQVEPSDQALANISSSVRANLELQVSDFWQEQIELPSATNVELVFAIGLAFFGLYEVLQILMELFVNISHKISNARLAQAMNRAQKARGNGRSVVVSGFMPRPVNLEHLRTEVSQLHEIIRRVQERTGTMAPPPATTGLTVEITSPTRPRSTTSDSSGSLTEEPNLHALALDVHEPLTPISGRLGEIPGTPATRVMSFDVGSDAQIGDGRASQAPHSRSRRQTPPPPPS